MEQAMYQCQSCRTRLNVSGLDSFQHEPAGGRGRPSARAASSLYDGASVYGGHRVDESFFVVDTGRKAQQGADAPLAGFRSQALDESWAVLGGQASMLGGYQDSADSLVRASNHGLPIVPNTQQLDTLNRAFEIASGETKVDQPLCRECAAAAQKMVDEELAVVEADITAYEAALARLEASPAVPLPQEQFEAELRQAEEEERSERERAERLEAELGEAEAELAELQVAAQELNGHEERYWHDFNDFQLQLRAHVEERDALLNKIERNQTQLARLQHTNVYNDVFYISSRGHFGTIAGLRLGRTTEHPVEWDEINAALGHTVLLIHILTQACGCTLASCRLEPMGSYPRVVVKGRKYELFGPVSRIYCHSYDFAMVTFLGAIREFAEFARARDQAAGTRAGGKEPFQLPFAIDGDKVGNYSIKMMMNKDARWTKALKLMLANVKWCQKWVAEQDGSQAHGASPSLSHQSSANLR